MIDWTLVVLVIIAFFLFILIILSIVNLYRYKDRNASPESVIRGPEHSNEQVYDNITELKEFEILNEPVPGTGSFEMPGTSETVGVGSLFPVSGWGQSINATRYLPDEIDYCVNRKHAVIRYFIGTTEKSAEMTSGSLSFGREPANDITISGDPYLGRRHAVISWENDSLIISNIEAKNGTMVNGKRIDQVGVIQGNSEIKMGSTLFKLEFKHLHPIERQ